MTLPCKLMKTYELLKADCFKVIKSPAEHAEAENDSIFPFHKLFLNQVIRQAGVLLVLRTEHQALKPYRFVNVILRRSHCQNAGRARLMSSVGDILEAWSRGYLEAS